MLRDQYLTLIQYSSRTLIKKYKLKINSLSYKEIFNTKLLN